MPDVLALQDLQYLDLLDILLPHEQIIPLSADSGHGPSKPVEKVRLFLGGLFKNFSIQLSHQVFLVEIGTLHCLQDPSGFLLFARPLKLLNVAAHDFEQNFGLLVSDLHCKQFMI